MPWFAPVTSATRGSEGGLVTTGLPTVLGFAARRPSVAAPPGRSAQDRQAVEHGLGLGDEAADELGRRHQLGDRANALSGGVALLVDVDAIGEGVATEVHGAAPVGDAQLLGELLELVGMRVVIVRVRVAHDTHGLAGV